jgi:flagellar assembly protein FliH
MSEFAAAERVSVWTRPVVPAGPVPFTAWGDALRAAFAPPTDPLLVPEPEPEAEIDLALLREEAFADGYAQGLAAGRAEAEPEIAACRRLAVRLDALKPEPAPALGSLIAATVERLLVEVMGQVEINRDTLLARAEAAAALIADETRPALLRLHPADAARLAGAELPVAVEADPALVPGALRLETGSGWIEDSPALRLEKLRVALDRVSASR